MFRFAFALKSFYVHGGFMARFGQALVDVRAFSVGESVSLETGARAAVINGLTSAPAAVHGVAGICKQQPVKLHPESGDNERSVERTYLRTCCFFYRRNGLRDNLHP